MKIVSTFILVLLSLISLHSQIPYQYGWPRQASDDFGLYKNSPTIADVDKDGSYDVSVTENIVSSGHMPKISIFKKNGTYLPYFPQSFPFGSLQSSGSREISAMGDVLGDDKLEIVFGDENGNIHVYQYNGQIPIGAPVNIGSNQECNTPALVDLDNDGKCEIIITTQDRDNSENGSLHVFKYSGSAFTELSGFPKNFPYGCESSPVVGDLDNDNQYEIVYLNGGSLSGGVYSAINAIELDGTMMPGFPIEFSHSSSGNTPSLYD
ncbi:MAG: FG-GAP repeat domain-containing protein, partial [Syntrophothermus sp.]